MNESVLDKIEGQRVEGRGTFIIKTYLHVLGAMLLFVGIEYYLFSSGLAAKIASTLTGVSWLLVLGGFMLISFVASHVAHRVVNNPVAQYAALGVFILAWAIMFVPLLFIAERVAPGAIQSAGIMTILAFVCLTAVVFFTRQDFSFLRPFLMWGGLVAMGVIVAAVLIPSIELGFWFSVAMVVYAGGAMLYDTSNVARYYQPGQHVAAALSLFSSVALMLWYMVQIFMGDE